jgi:hypothetical protein
MAAQQHRHADRGRGQRGAEGLGEGGVALWAGGRGGRRLGGLLCGPLGHPAGPSSASTICGRIRSTNARSASSIGAVMAAKTVDLREPGGIATTVYRFTGSRQDPRTSSCLSAAAGGRAVARLSGRSGRCGGRVHPDTTRLGGTRSR